MRSEFRQGFLAGESCRGESVAELVTGDFDYVLLSSSWDRRCLCITEAINLRSQHCCVFMPSLRDELGLMDEHDKRLIAFADKLGERFVLRGDDIGIDVAFGELLAHLQSIRDRLKRPLRLFVDLSTCPRYLSMGVVAFSMQHGIANAVTCYYAEGDYPEEKSEEDAHEFFTSGGWDAIPVPSLEGEWDPEKLRAYVVSIGFEGSKTLRLVSREEPDAISILLPDPGVKQEYLERALRLNEPLFKRYGISEKRVIRAAAGDAIEAWKQLELASVERPGSQNLYYICCGTKAHSLALTLRAMVLRHAAVLYVVPDRHRVVQVEPLGVYWCFNLADMSSLGASLGRE